MLVFEEQENKLSKHKNEFKTKGNVYEVESKQMRPLNLLYNYVQTTYIYRVQMSLQHLAILCACTPRSI